MVLCRALATFLPSTASAIARAPAVAGAAVPFLFGIRTRDNPAVEVPTLLLAHRAIAHGEALRGATRGRKPSVVAEAIDWMVEVAEAGALGWGGPSAGGERRHKTKKQLKYLRKLRNSAAARES